MGVDFIYPEFEVVRNKDRCIGCRVCERQCANEVHWYDSDRGVMMSDETKCVNCQRCVSLCPTRALKIVKSDCRLRENANWPDATIKEVYKQAGSGGVLLSSMGNPNPLPVYWDKILINASQVTNPPIDPLREPMETKVFLGKKPDKIERDENGDIKCVLPPQIELSMPVMFSAMSYGSISYNAHKSLAMAASELGILYNTTMVSDEEVSTWNVLWDEAYKDSIIMQNSVRDSFTPALRLLGYDINTTDENQLNDALDLLIRQKPLVYAYYVDETGDEMAMGNAAMALVYSGEAAYAMELNDDLSYSVPEEGSNLWIDSWFMPKSCHNTEYAEKFLDFLCREDIGMLNFDYVYYATPNLAVKENLDEETLSDTTIFPTDETLANCEVYKQYDIDTTKLSNYLWKKLKSE